MAISDPTASARQRYEQINQALENEYIDLRDGLVRSLTDDLRVQFPGLLGSGARAIAERAVAVMASSPARDPLRDRYVDLATAVDVYLDRYSSDPDGEQTRFARRNMQEALAASGARLM